MTILAATPLEAQAVRRAVPSATVVESGIGLSRVQGRSLGEVVISCGLAGGLRAGVRTGTGLVPDNVRAPNGELVRCDPELSEALAAAAAGLNIEIDRGTLVTTAHLVTGDERRALSARGYAAVDMETGLIRAPRLAAVRVVLDTPEREISAAWLHPAAALLQPRYWGEFLWMLREAPRCARLAASILGAAFRTP